MWEEYCQQIKTSLLTVTFVFCLLDAGKNEPVALGGLLSGLRERASGCPSRFRLEGNGHRENILSPTFTT